MPDFSKPVDCSTCRKPFVRTHHLQKRCPKCQGGRCTDCKRPSGEHAQNCRRGKRASGGAATRPTKPVRSARVRKPVASPNGHRADFLQAELDAAKVRVGTLRDDLRREELRVELLTELCERHGG